MLGHKYGDFFKKSPNFVPRIKLAHFHPNLFKRNQTQFLKKFHNHEYIDRILIPHVTRVRLEDDVAPDQRALLIFNTFRGHLTPAVKD